MSACNDESQGQGCGCDSTDESTPSTVNRPGQSALAYRVGTHSSFLQRMLDRLHTFAIPDGDHQGERPLAALTTRSARDPAIALLDAWAITADVLTFYQERIANEGYLRTATEERSVLELALTIGYEPKPGVAASTYLAFTLETTPGAPESVALDEGVKVLSVPGQNQKPQTFETVEAIEARGELNALKPQMTEKQELARFDDEGAYLGGVDHLYLSGTDLRLQVGDVIVVVGDERLNQSEMNRWDLRTLIDVQVSRADGYTRVQLDRALGYDNGYGYQIQPPEENPKIYVFRQRAALFGYNAPDWIALPYDVRLAYTQQATAGATVPAASWPDFDVAFGTTPTIDLDAVYPKVLPDGWVALIVPSFTAIYHVESVASSSNTNYTLTARTTRVELDTDQYEDEFNDTNSRREILVLAQTEALELAERPMYELIAGVEIYSPVLGDDLLLDARVTGLEKDRKVIVTGKRLRARVEDQLVSGGEVYLSGPASSRSEPLQAGDLLYLIRQIAEDESGNDGGTFELMDRYGFVGTLEFEDGDLTPEAALEDDDVISELAVVQSAEDEQQHDGSYRTRLEFQSSLSNIYDRSTVSIYANVALATHGESIQEALGSGDGTQSNQSFTLKHGPLTYVSAQNASGAESTLEVRVDGVLWEEVESLYGLTARSRSYTVRRDEDGNSAVTFGDGTSGARLPSGRENVKAGYRFGLGSDGSIDAGRLSLLKTRPLGVKSVINPLAASGAEDAESLEDTRINAPTSVVILDRLVSRSDYESFARTYAGIGKARSTLVILGTVSWIHLTVGTADGSELSTTLADNLRGAVEQAGAPGVTVVIADYTPAWFKLSADLLVDSAYVVEDVHAQVKTLLEEAYAYTSRSFGQSVTTSEVISLIHHVAGVTAVNLKALYRSNQANESLESEIAPASAYWDETLGEVVPAELLLLDVSENAIKLGAMSS